MSRTAEILPPLHDSCVLVHACTAAMVGFAIAVPSRHTTRKELDLLRCLLVVLPACQHDPLEA